MPSIKEQHEIAIGNNLLKFLQCDSQLLRHGKDDGEPDLIYSLDSRTVGIEVTTAYYDDGQAKAEWKLARVQVDGAKFSLDNADKLIASRVRQPLATSVQRADLHRFPRFSGRRRRLSRLA